MHKDDPAVEILPDYLAAMPPATDAEIWDRMQSRFDLLKDVVQGTRLETWTEAVGKHKDTDEPKPRWVDTDPRWEEHGMPVRAWQMIPFIKAIDQNALADRISRAAALIEPLENCFRCRELTVRFAHMWGAFCDDAGAVHLAYASRRDDMSAGRKLLSKGAAQKKWVAIQLMDLMGQGLTRSEAEAVVLRRIREILGANDPPKGFPKAWFRVIVVMKGGTANALRPTFMSRHYLPNHELADAAGGPFDVPNTRY